MNRLWLVLLLALAANAGAETGAAIGGPGARALSEAEEESKVFREEASELPAYPRPENLREFYVSAVASNKFYVDASTLSVGNDGVVRYVLVVKTSGGATNVTFEGIHCDQHTWKIYATGHSDGTWKRSRALRNDWRPIENKPVNRHHSVLRHELFCPMGIPIKNPDEGRNALRLGKHPEAN
ncbi:MAG: CNP1-like family protein [Burkholderiaceae bacterium]|nr:CNP1-like family protein [Sulfuritalea sp.]MCF8174966.1 CNP1-like family protein [Burkholderiaceae bacterium]MCF8183808.1 CNP1-like family protein [Polynucleobacter sp.]